MAEKKEKFGYEGQCKRRKKFRKGIWYRGVRDFAFVSSIRRRLRNAGELDPQASSSCTGIFLFSA